MNTAVAAMIGRPDLAPPLVMAPGGQTMQTAPYGSFQTSVSGDVSLGQTSLGMLAGMVVAFFLFYVWTRGRQA